MHKLFSEAKAISAELMKQGTNEAEYCRVQLRLEQTLMRLSQRYVADEVAVQGKLCRRIVRSVKELFVFVTHPDVPAHNNAAERSLRHLVISRKVSGGTRSETGSQTKMIRATLLGTWRATGLNPFIECRSLFTSPLLNTYEWVHKVVYP